VGVAGRTARSGQWLGVLWLWWLWLARLLPPTRRPPGHRPIRRSTGCWESYIGQTPFL